MVTEDHEKVFTISSVFEKIFPTGTSGFFAPRSSDA
jgi:hypothetical protein